MENKSDINKQDNSTIFGEKSLAGTNQNSVMDREMTDGKRGFRLGLQEENVLLVIVDRLTKETSIGHSKK